MCLILVNAYNNGYEIRTSFDNDKTRNRKHRIKPRRQIENDNNN